MRYIKKYENVEVENEYFAYIDIEKLEKILNNIQEYDLKYTLYLLKSTQIALFLIFKVDENFKNYMRNIFSITYIYDNPDTISNIKEKCEDITDMTLSEIEEIFDIFNQSKKYNI